MDLKQFEFPKITGLDMVFSTLNTIPELLKEAKERKFHCANTIWNKYFSKLFFEGGKLEYRKDIDKDFINRAGLYVKCFMRSFSPKHEDKEAICAMIFSEIIDEKFVKKEIK